MKYFWIAKSDDGSFEDKSREDFFTKKSAYEDMRKHALEKMSWNTEWTDLDCNGDSIGYEVHFSVDKIIHKSYSGEYTYEIVSLRDDITLYGSHWWEISSFVPKEPEDWEVADFGEIGKLWMNNCDGYKVLVEPNGTILKSYI